MSRLTMNDESLKLLRLIAACPGGAYRVPTAWRDALPDLERGRYVAAIPTGDRWGVKATDAGHAFLAGIDYVTRRP